MSATSPTSSSTTTSSIKDGFYEPIYDSEDESDIELHTEPHNSKRNKDESSMVLSISARLRRWLLRLAMRDENMKRKPFLSNLEDMKFYELCTFEWIIDRANGKAPLTVKEYDQLSAIHIPPERCVLVNCNKKRLTLMTQLHIMKSVLLYPHAWKSGTINMKLPTNLDEFYPSSNKLNMTLEFPPQGELYKALMWATESAKPGQHYSAKMLEDYATGVLPLTLRTFLNLIIVGAISFPDGIIHGSEQLE
jgi:hypothetical protein